MTRFAITLLCWLPALVGAARADNLAIQPGQWKVTTNIVMNGATAPAQNKLRWLTSEHARDVAKTCGPVSGTVNSECEPATPETTGKNMKWHLQCKGAL